MGFQIIISENKYKKNYWYCEDCKTWFKNENQKHNCNDIKLKKYMRKKIRNEVVKFSTIGFFTALILFLAILITIYKSIIYEYSNMLHFVKEEMKMMQKVTDAVLSQQNSNK